MKLYQKKTIANITNSSYLLSTWLSMHAALDSFHINLFSKTVAFSKFFPNSHKILCSPQCIKKRNSLSPKKIFRQINSLVTYLGIY